ncbi:unnamed protein product [Amoebophrya sp. A25]|nr:unnamed protein product [Amoebophrya sp. A25]|eukprot:GSA25T00026417001.1
MGHRHVKTQIGVFTCPSYDVNVQKSKPSAGSKTTPASKNAKTSAAENALPPLSVENKCPLFAMPGARIYGFPMAANHNGHQVMSIRPNYPSFACNDPENHTHSEEHIEAVGSFLKEHIKPSAMVSTKPIASYTCRYPQLAIGPEGKFGAVLDFVPGYESRVVLASGFDGYGFKYGSLYGKEVLDLLATHTRVAGLEWEKKPAENAILRALHNVIDLLLKAAGGDDGEAVTTTGAGEEVRTAEEIAEVEAMYQRKKKETVASCFTGCQRCCLAALFVCLFFSAASARYWQGLMLLALNVAYTFGSEVAFRTPQNAEDWRRAALIWAVHYAWTLGGPLLTYFVASSLLLSGVDTELSGTSDRLSAALLFLAVVLTSLGTYVRYRSMDECDHYDRSARGIALSDDTYSDLKSKQTTTKSSSAARDQNNRKETQTSSSTTAAADCLDKREVLTKTGIYGCCRHPGFAAHILDATSLALLLGSWSLAVSAEVASADVGQLSFGTYLMRTSVFAVFLPCLHAAIAYGIFVYSANDEEKSFMSTEEFKVAYEEYRKEVPNQFNFVSNLAVPISEAVAHVRCGGSQGISERRIFLKLLGLFEGTRVDFLDPVNEPELIEKVLEGSNKGYFIEELIACPAWHPVRSVESVSYPEAMKMKESLGMVFAKVRIFERLDAVIDEVVSRDRKLRAACLPSLLKSASEVTTASCSTSSFTDHDVSPPSSVSTDSSRRRSSVDSEDTPTPTAAAGEPAAANANKDGKGISAEALLGLLGKELEVAEEDYIGCPDVTRHSFEVFFKLLTDRFPTEEESALAHKAVDEWRKMIAMKGLADHDLKIRFLDFMRNSLKTSPFFQKTPQRPAGEKDTRSETQKMADDYVFDWDNVNTLSCVLQPMIISPMINFADVFSSLKKILDSNPHWRDEICAPSEFSEAPPGTPGPSANTGENLGLVKRTRSEEVADRVVLEGMRCAHPFPILERKLNKDVSKNGQVRFTKGTQVFIEYDQSCVGQPAELPSEDEAEKNEGSGGSSGAAGCPFLSGGGSALGVCPVTGMQSPLAATRFDPNRWHDEGKCPFRAVPFGSGVRRCFGQKVARVILRKLLVAYAHNWDRFDPSRGHSHSGRNNDSDPGDTLYVAKNLLRCLGDGLAYRLGGGQ